MEHGLNPVQPQLSRILLLERVELPGGNGIGLDAVLLDMKSTHVFKYGIHEKRSDCKLLRKTKRPRYIRCVPRPAAPGSRGLDHGGPRAQSALSRDGS